MNDIRIYCGLSDLTEIYIRRINETAKGRLRYPGEDPDMIELHQRMTLAETEATARKLGAGFSVVLNVDNPEMTEQNVRFLMKQARDITLED